MQHFRKYEILEEIGRGGMGVVYKVRHRQLATVYALKVLGLHDVNDQEGVRRFDREAQVMAQLRHQNIVRVFDIDKEDGRYFFVMDYIQGRSLRAVIDEEGRRPIAEVLEVMLQVARGLECAHTFTPPVVHRDVKPGNILIEENTSRALVTDFGIAKLLHREETVYSLAGVFIGTPRYAAPEQLLSAHDIDARADLYALGLVAYEMITGRRLFDGQSMDSMIAWARDPGDNVVDLGSGVPEVLHQLVTRLVVKDRQRRYQTAADLVADIERLQARLRRAATVLSGKPSTTSGIEADTDGLLQGDLDTPGESIVSASVVEEARRKASDARDDVRHDRAVGTYAAEALKRADEAWASAERARAARNDETAVDAFEDAARAYRQAQRTGRLEAARAEAGSARQRAVVAREEADRNGAQQLAPAEYADGKTNEGRAEGALAADRFEMAISDYGRAEDAYAAAAAIARRAAERDRAVEARAAADRAHAMAAEAGASRTASYEVARGESLREAAGRLLEEEDYPRANELFAQASDAFEQATKLTVAKREEEAARAASNDVARSLAAHRDGQLQGRALRIYRKAHQAYETGLRELERGAHAEARRRFAEAFTELGKLTTVGDDPTVVERGPVRRWRRIMFASGGVALVLVLGWVAWSPDLLTGLRSPRVTEGEPPAIRKPEAGGGADLPVPSDQADRRPQAQPQVSQLGERSAAVAERPSEGSEPGRLNPDVGTSQRTGSELRLAVSPPQRAVQIRECETTTFAVASTAQNARFEWLVDGERQTETGERFSYAPRSLGVHTIGVRARNGGPTHIWDVTVRTERPSEAEVRGWLEDYRRALETKDIEQLQALGAVRSDAETAALSRKLEPRLGYEVHLEDLSFTANDGTVTVNFGRVDRWREAGRPSAVIDFAADRAKLVRRDCRIAAIP